jgi:hypothetical protein
MRRRAFITLLGGAAAAWPLTARAQQREPMWRIGMLEGFAESNREGQERAAAFREGLKQLGWIEGRNIRIDVPAMPVVGFLRSGTLTDVPHNRVITFRQGLKETAYVEGEDIVIEPGEKA